MFGLGKDKPKVQSISHEDELIKIRKLLCLTLEYNLKTHGKDEETLKELNKIRR